MSLLMQPSSKYSVPRILNPKLEGQPDRWAFVKRAGLMWNEAMTWYPAWKELAQFNNPTRGFFFDEVPNRGKQIDFKTVIDGHARRAVRTLASGMTSGLTSPSRPWFRLGLPDPNLADFTPAKIWLDEVQNRMLDVFAKSNIYGVLHSMYEEIGTFGTACCFIEEDSRDVIRGRVYTAGEYFLACGADGRVNAFYRRFWMTTFQLVEQFGKENCSQSTQAAYTNNQDTWRKVHHLIEVNDDRIPSYKDFKNMPFRSIYWEDGSMVNTYLDLGGFEEFPCLTPRWDTTTTADSYGRGPGWDALGDVKMLQKMRREYLTGLAKVINPPMQKDANVQGDVNTMPGGITTSSSNVPNAGLRPAYQINPDLAAMNVAVTETKQAISQAFFADLFLMLQDDNRSGITATEIAERQAEKLQILGPVLERLENELLNPLIARTFAIMYRAGLFPPPPPEIAGMELKIQYISILAQAQKMASVTAIDQWTGSIIAEAEQTQDMSVLDIINFDEKNAEKADMLGVPAKIVNSPNAIAQKRQSRAQQQQAAQQAALMNQGADTGAKMAGAVKSLSDASVGGDEDGSTNALDQILNTAKGSAR